ncbi:MAG TPA: phosphate signaling complex protein PhoU [Gemmatimonadota bacterium]|nr:phosphate signaling complex protein PhoU [Gemmatimonadota bacterium]
MSPDDSAKASRHFDQELAELRDLLLQMASLAEEQVRAALAAVKRRDAQTAQRAMERDREVDALELDIEERSINLLARRQPMAVDLRMLVSTLKISNDLERVGDHAVNIAQCARRLAETLPVSMPSELERMADVATGMLRDAIEAFIERDVTLAREVLVRDDEVDRYNDVVFRLMLKEMSENTNKLIPGLQLMLVSRNLERIADLATNLAEDVIYIVEARSIKHHVREMKSADEEAPASDHEAEGEWDQ